MYHTMPRIRPKRRRHAPKYSEYRQSLLLQAQKDHVFNRFLTIQKARESPPFSFFSVQPEDFWGFTRSSP